MMKLRNIGKTFGRVIVNLLFAALPITAISNTYTQTGVSSGMDTFTSGTYWSGGIAPSDATAEGHDFVSTISGFRTPGNTTFHCNSLTIGSADSWMKLYFKEGSWTFQDGTTGLVFVRAEADDWTAGTKTYYVNGPVTFKDTWCNGQSGRYAYDFGGGKPEANAVVQNFTGKVNCDSGAAVRIAGNYSTARHGMGFTGDLSGFYGTMEAGQSGFLLIGPASGSATIPGTVKASSSTSRITHSSGSSGFSVGNLELADGATIDFAANRNAGTCQSITVTGSYVYSGMVNLVLTTETYDGSPVAAARYPVIVAPAGTLLDETKFTCSASGARIVVDEDGENRPTVYVERNAYVTRVPGQEYSSSATTWSDGLAPHGNADYYSGNVDGNFRLHAGNGYVSPVSSLTIANKTAVTQFTDMTISNVILATDVTFANWYEGDKSTNTQYAVGGTKHFRGKIDLANKSLDYTTTANVYFIIDADISGTGRLNVNKNDGFATYLELTGDNTFTGIQNNYIGNAGFANGIYLCFWDVKNLGGNPSTFTYDAAKLGDYAVYKALASTTLNRMNRGIHVAESAFEVVDGATLAIEQKIRFSSGKVLHKFGGGTLCLAGALDLSQNSNPTISVEAGGIQAGSTNSFQNTTVAFSGDGYLVADYAATGDVATYGLFNTAATPFVLNAQGLLPVKFRNVPEDTAGAKVPILTVNASAAAALRGKIALGKQRKGLAAGVEERVNADGSVTFLASLFRTGMTIIIS